MEQTKAMMLQELEVILFGQQTAKMADIASQCVMRIGTTLVR